MLQRLEKRRPWARREKFIPTSKLESLSGKALVGEGNRSVGRELGKRAEQGPCQKARLASTPEEPACLRPEKASDFRTESPPEWTVTYGRGTGGGRAQGRAPALQGPRAGPTWAQGPLLQSAQGERTKFWDQVSPSTSQIRVPEKNRGLEDAA